MPYQMGRPYPAYRVNGYKPATFAPMSEINTTPLIDVLLVLLIMIVLSVPLATNTLEVDLPGEPAAQLGEPVQIALTISAAGQIGWNGEPVSTAQLQQRLETAAARSRESVIRFEPDANASYDASVKVINQVHDAGLTNFAFIGNARHREFARD